MHIEQFIAQRITWHNCRGVDQLPIQQFKDDIRLAIVRATWKFSVRTDPVGIHQLAFLTALDTTELDRIFDDNFQFDHRNPNFQESNFSFKQ